jgi:hypothetical protein
MMVTRVLMLELASRGHQVTEITPFLETKVVPNYTQITVAADIASATGGNRKRKGTGNWKHAWSEIYLLNSL